MTSPEPVYASVSPSEYLPDSEDLAFSERKWKKQYSRSTSSLGIALLGSGDGQPAKSSVWTRRIKSRLPTGWRFGAWLATFGASVVLLVNIFILVWSATESGGSPIGIGFQGNCNTMNRYSVGIHLVINVLSTVLLGASNYVMQTLCAPTRDEVNRAHEKGIWLDIGLQSIRNLKYTSRLNRLLWIALSISSIPLHLAYNSSFSSTLSAEKYYMLPAIGPDLLTMTPNADGRYNWTCGSTAGCPGHVPEAELSQWDVLNNAECIKAYATDFVSDRATVVPVIGDYYLSNDTVVTLAALSEGGGPEGSGVDSYEWICSGMEIDYHTEPLLCASASRRIDPFNWTIQIPGDLEVNRGYTNSKSVISKVNYCLSQPVVPKCQLNFNVPLWVLVIVLNMIKVGSMAFAAVNIKENALVTVGDAIASFTSDPDIHTRDMCLASSDIFDGREIGETVCLEYQSRRIRWFGAASKGHWIMTVSLFALAIFISIGLLIYALRSLGLGIGVSAMWQLGIGKPHAQSMITGWKIPTEGYSALLASVLVSNSPQLILSMIYLVFNSLCTKMFLAREWSSYSHARKPLRVSAPRGVQRSTYFLQIPYRFGLPLMGYSALLHWLVSQSIFPVQVTYRDLNNNQFPASSCGYSPIAIILTIITTTAFILSAIITGFCTHLNGDMPLVGSCSAAISASCHPPIPDGSDPLKPMKWGAVAKYKDVHKKQSDVGHISFSSGDVFEPIPGCYYF
ncbi:hypothetical protein D9757_008367 [Collybiopsis confluens]|uniref:DUF6536 domain-containing protein n=1 Tax=Collybiopsis confluens TaxID=2823264 RepID=A0A8H5HEH1_9AGAR|nr:hypothetical protein D9757_008367 [Collybiopsis confluens]